MIAPGSTVASARAAATIVAVTPTLDAKSQVSASDLPEFAAIVWPQFVALT
ncbi:hypothetical protein BH09ACT7_BH09ACT7_59190 [soil metagenome]